jgi:hypothetical protein
MKSKERPSRRIANNKSKASVRTKKQKSRSPISLGVTSVLSKMRAGSSLRKAARESGVAPRSVLRRAASALRKTESGRYRAKASDRLIRTLKIPTVHGPQEIQVRGLREASILGRYWVAVHKYYENGDASVQKFSGESITAVDGTKYLLLTDFDVLNRLGSAGVLSFESLYGTNA